MKILIPLIGGFGKSGGFRVLSQLANYWVTEGHEVTFLSYVNTEEPYYPTKASVVYYNDKGKVSDVPDITIQLPKLGALGLRNKLRKALETFDVDIVLANHCLTAQPVKKANISAKKFYYVQAYEPDYFYQKNIKNIIYKFISKKSYTLGLNLIVNAPMYLNYKEIKTDRYVVPGLDLNIFKFNENQEPNNKIIIGTIGRSEEYKGTKYIIEAFKEIRSIYGGRVELHVAFGDEALSEIDGVKVLKPNGDVNLAKYYNTLNMYICAGTIQLEAVHYPIIEAMACRVPVITTGYLPANEKNAYIVTVKESKSIVDMVIKVINEGENVKQDIAYNDIREFDWNKVSRKMLNYFKESLESN